MNMTSREQKLFIIALVIILFISIYNWVYLPLNENYFQELNRENELIHQLDSNRMIIARGPRYQAMIENTSKMIEEYKNLFFQKELSDVRLEISNVIDQQAIKNNLVLENKVINIFEANNEITGTDISRVEYRGSFRGDYKDILHFLNKLNNQEELYQVTELQLSGDENSDVLSLFITITVYCIGDDKNEI
ncbi:hypothetical protein [Natronospora cellulosivora (SeqCode)]